MSQLAVTLGKNSLIQLGVSLTDITLLFEWGKRFGNFLRAADNDADLVRILSEPQEVLLPRTNLVETVRMEARWSNIDFVYRGETVTSEGKSLVVDKNEKSLTRFGWLMVAVVMGLDLCLSRSRVLNVLVDVLAAVLGRENEIEESLRIVLPTNIESWRQVGRVKKMNRALEMRYMKVRRAKVGTDVVPQLNDAEEREMRKFLVWLMKMKGDNHFSAIPIDIYALAAGLQAVGVSLTLDGPRTLENEVIVEYCSGGGLPGSSKNALARDPVHASRAMQVSYPLTKPEAMIQSIPAARPVLNRMNVLWELGRRAAESFHLEAQSPNLFGDGSEVWYHLRGGDMCVQGVDTRVQILADRAFPTSPYATGNVLEAVENLLKGMKNETYSWLSQHLNLDYLKRSPTTSGNEEQMNAMLHFQALVFGFYFKLLSPLVCFDLVEPTVYCQGLWGTGSNLFLSMCIELASILQQPESRVSRAHVLFMLSSMYNGRQKPFTSAMRPGLLGVLGSISLLSMPLVRTVDTPSEIGRFMMIDLPIIDLAAADVDGEIYAGAGTGIQYSRYEGPQKDIAARRPLESWSVHAKMGVSVEGGLNGVVMAAICSGRLVGWFNPLAADVTFLSTAYQGSDDQEYPEDYATATVRGVEITDRDWQSGYLPLQVDQDCCRVVQSWGCPALRYAAAGFFASLGEEVAIATKNLEGAFGRIELQGSGVIIT